MKLFSSTDFAIASALKDDSLRLVDREGRFGPFVSIEDRFGLIEVANDMHEAKSRVASIQAAIAA